MKSKQCGFTLIELLVTLLLASVLLLALGASMSAITRSQSLVDDYEEIQETLRFTTAILSRGLRSAKYLIEDTEDSQLELKRTARQDSDDNYITTACNGQKPDNGFIEVYKLSGSKLQCEVKEADISTPSPNWVNEVTLAYGIKEIEFLCMPYDESSERDFLNLVDCSDDPKNVIAVKTTITFDKDELKQIDREISHSFVTTLRTRLGHCATGKDQNGVQVNCSQ